MRATWLYCRVAVRVMVGILIIMTSGGAPTSEASGPLWAIVPSPNGSTTSISNNTLQGTATISSTDVWAVGAWSSSTLNNINHTLAEHWNGATWSLVPSPNVGGLGSSLSAVAALSATNVWAVGMFLADNSGATGDRTLIEHWNGAAWRAIPSPNASREGDNLTGVAAISPANVWAVGYFETNNQSAIEPLFEHFDGRGWRIVPAPFVPGSVFVTGVSAASADDIWVVGHNDNVGIVPVPFAAHWNGLAWSAVAVPRVGTGENKLFAVQALSATDVWAVGESVAVAPPVEGIPTQTLIEHFDGARWSVAPSPNNGALNNHLSGITALSGAGIWAVGSYEINTSTTLHTLTLHWNGAFWSVVPSPNNVGTGVEASQSNVLSAAAALSPSTIWAVGNFDNLDRGNPGLRTVILRTTHG